MKNKLHVFVKKIKIWIKDHNNRLTMPKGSYTVLKEANDVHANNPEKAIHLLSKALESYPNSYPIRAMLVDFAMTQKNWELAIEQWDVIFKLKKKKVKVPAYLGFAKALKQNNNNKKAENILKAGLKYYPKNIKLMQEYAENLITQKKWSKATEMWDKLLDAEIDNLPVNSYIRAALSYRKLGDYWKAEQILERGMKKYTANKRLRVSYADIAIYKKEWDAALLRLKKACGQYKQKAPMNLVIKRSMIYQIIGNHSESNRLFQYVLDNYHEEIQNDSKGYRKIVLFNNGESRIEFYKRLQKTESVIVTFDSLNMVWKNPSFGFKLLTRQNLDIIAVRKKQPNTQHQDLTIDEFYKAVNGMVESSYKHKIAYGYSLGGYTSLYYGASINCTILSLAPRLSIHPKYGKPKEIGKSEFKHSLSLPYNSAISPIVVYDPKEKLDNRYVQEEVTRAFPCARLIKIPYGGHGIAPHLLRMGLLKEFILKVIEEEVPRYDRKKKSKSNIYYRVLGQACLKRNKLKWARDLSEKSLELLSTDKYGIKLKINVLKKQGNYDEAINYAKKAVDLVPKVIEIREQLIDLYLETGDMKKANEELMNAIDKFGRTETLKRLEERLVTQKNSN
ncbi:tetratricopeptide repeat protein [Virgibacillus oceani]|uniref:Tetratricopeptide repeat protein n=1 Tax=Virgibacillus oceani TaxID=1479511 RepID=A0A917HBI9_9BACI|nr:tetratricopeptide repeat protein [Virgibacillus oceani]GGG73419.1 hypothetical protein GCM10011398_17340 [Virgibacillus oceani]